ncbi:hypothetical protein [Nocardia sp. NPDC051833]|uniref:hypothetical protein n=1 Tax=Nocardia sp. NPDC051833 TaxID=3155674 RepID=UPI003418969A
MKSYFDVGQSRSLPWHRRTEAAKPLDDLRDPHRGWAGIVVGEGTRYWFGNQLSLVAPRIHAYSVSIWVPELAAATTPTTSPHTMMMNMLGGLSESKRQHVQTTHARQHERPSPQRKADTKADVRRTATCRQFSSRSSPKKRHESAGRPLLRTMLGTFVL